MDKKSNKSIGYCKSIINQSFDRTFPRKTRQNDHKFFSNDQRYPKFGIYFDAWDVRAPQG